MKADSDAQRMLKIYEMLFAMAGGNMAFRIATDGPDAALNVLAARLNALAESIQPACNRLGYVTADARLFYATHLSFLLDATFAIQNCTSDVTRILGYTAESLREKNFTSILSLQSVPLWEAFQNTARAAFPIFFDVTFLTQDGNSYPAVCVLTSFGLYCPYLVSSITIKARQPFAKATPPADAVLVQQLHDYIITHLDEPLPGLHALAALLGTNAFKLKESFRHFFQTSVYHFYQEQRLQRAYTMIAETATPLKEIAFGNGFNSYLNFYKAFKKRFGVAPGKVLRSV